MLSGTPNEKESVSKSLRPSFMFTQSPTSSDSSLGHLVVDPRGLDGNFPESNAFQQIWTSDVVATAMAVSALVLSEQHGGELGTSGQPEQLDSAYQGDLSELLIGSLHWLAKRQQDDGGWSGTGRPPSQLATTVIVRATFQLTGTPVAYPLLSERSAAFTRAHGDLDAFKSDESSASLIVSGVAALADMIDWKRLPSVPIETSSLHECPEHTQFWLDHQHDEAALLALGLASFKLHRPFNPITSWRRSAAVSRVLDFLRREQQPDGSFAHSVSSTSLVIMSLASAGLTTSSVVRRGVEFLYASVKKDDYWVDAAPEADSTGTDDSNE